MPDPKLHIAVENPTLDTLALLVELADHIGVPGDTDVEPYVLGGRGVRLAADPGVVYVPPIDWDQADEEGPDA